MTVALPAVTVVAGACDLIDFGTDLRELDLGPDCSDHDGSGNEEFENSSPKASTVFSPTKIRASDLWTADTTCTPGFGSSSSCILPASESSLTLSPGPDPTSLYHQFEKASEEHEVVRRKVEAKPDVVIVLDKKLTFNTVRDWDSNRWFNLLLSQISLKRKRQSGKGPEYLSILRTLKQEPLTDIATIPGVAKYNWNFGRKAWDVYVAVVSSFTGQTVTKLRKELIAKWTETPKNNKMKWYYLSLMLGDHVASAVEHVIEQRAVVEPNESPTTMEKVVTENTGLVEQALGIALTYNTTIGMKDPQVLQWIREALPQEQYNKKLAKHPLHETLFGKFTLFIQDLQEKYRYPVYAACMESSANSKTPGRIHLHAFIGMHVSGTWAYTVKKTELPTLDLLDFVFEGLKPCARTPQPYRYQARCVCESISRAVYYVMCQKPSTIMRDSNAWPNKDVPYTLTPILSTIAVLVIFFVVFWRR